MREVGFEPAQDLNSSSLADIYFLEKTMQTGGITQENSELFVVARKNIRFKSFTIEYLDDNMAQIDNEKVAELICVPDWYRSSSALSKAAEIVRGLQLDSAHLDGELRHGLINTDTARRTLVKKVQDACENAKQWASQTVAVKGSDGKYRTEIGGKLMRLDYVDPSAHEVARSLTSYLERQLRSLERSVTY